MMTTSLWRCGRHLVAGVALASVPAVMSMPGLTRSVALADTGAGCTPSRKAVAFDGQGALLIPQPTPAPFPCMVTTGYGGSETRVVVTIDGTIVYEPAILTPGLAGTGYLAGAPGPHPSTQFSPGGLATTHDLGSTWQFVAPSGATWVPQDDQLYTDRSTGWLYYYALSPDPVPDTGGVPLQDELPAGYAQLMTSPDDGTTWYHSSLPGYVESENPRFASAPVPVGQPEPARYAPEPTVVYWCGNNTLFVERYRACYRSLDGGVSWSFASILFSTPIPQHGECGDNGENFSAGDGNYPEGAPDGSLYVLVSCGNATYLARSTDEGAAWPLLTDGSGKPRVVPADGELRIDRSGNLYLAAKSGDALLLWVSLDGGASWQSRGNMVAPGASGVSEWFMAEGGIGGVAVSYLAHTGAGAGYNGYVTATKNALDASPVYWGVTVNDPASPLLTGSPAAARDDFIGADIGPDGTPWASFFASCTAGDPDPACAGQASNPEANKAVAARLVWP